MRITAEGLRHIYQHATRTYPYECFGFLIGSAGPTESVVQIVPGSNALGNQPDRFEMDAAEFLAVEAAAEQAGLEIIGFYHSHPDWPAVPSAADLRSAWPGSCYLIVTVHAAHPTSVAAWRLSGDAPSRFVEMPLEVLADACDSTGDATPLASQPPP
jgi:proteasome lid subunit RPN8/RPN11